ncbi:FAD binding domain protein [Hypoxylon argillaceum]|nr:FAD binding domain protein [Hypoxylon argillaceum]
MYPIAVRLSDISCHTRLSTAFPSKVSYPGTATYSSAVSSYWAQQQQLMSPSCIFAPSSAKDISQALSNILVPGSCIFAVRGGGHASLTAASNTNEGVTIDLRGINSTSLSEDNSKVSVGGGQTIGNIYTLLAQYGLTIPAARDFSIGIGGSTLGGGGNNFGIVTKFVFSTFPLGGIWAGDVVLSSSKDTVEKAATALYNFVANPNYDVNASAFVTYGFSSGVSVVLTEYTYTAPVSNASVFAELLSIPGEKVSDTTAITTLPQLSKQSDGQSPSGLQQITFAISFENNVEMMVKAWDILNASSPKIQDIEGSSWGLTLEPIVPSMIVENDVKYETVFDLQLPPEGLIMTICSANFNRSADYAYVSGAVQQLLSDLTSAAKGLGIYNRYIDMNHAMAGQDPLASYGAKSLGFLKTTAIKYDPKRIFQTLMPGGFKLRA